jgi:general nucleoside transport system permease protein
LRLRLPITVERRLEVPRWLPLAVTIGAVAVSFVISGLIILLVGGDPIKSFQHMFNAAFGSPGVISDTLVKATPLILTGLACALAFRMRLWNIGAEGQFLMGAWGASAVVFLPLLPAGTSALITIPMMMLAGFAAGAAWGFIPGALKARFSVNEIIVTLMLNYIALLWITYWVFGPWSSGGLQITDQFPREAWLPRLTDLAKVVPDFGGLTVHLGFVFGVVAAFIVWFMLRRTRWGFEIRLIGDNPRAARYAGINIARNIVVVFMVSGGLAGLAGMSEVAGSAHVLQTAISPGYGFTAIIVAFLGRLNPLGILLAALIVALSYIGGENAQVEVGLPQAVTGVFQGMLLFFLLAVDLLVRFRPRYVAPLPARA